MDALLQHSRLTDLVSERPATEPVSDWQARRFFFQGAITAGWRHHEKWRGLDNAFRAVGYALLDFIDPRYLSPEGNPVIVTPSWQVICEMCRVSRRSFYDAISELFEARFITVSGSRGRQIIELHLHRSPESIPPSMPAVDRRSKVDHTMPLFPEPSAAQCTSSAAQCTSSATQCTSSAAQCTSSAAQCTSDVGDTTSKINNVTLSDLIEDNDIEALSQKALEDLGYDRGAAGAIVRDYAMRYPNDFGTGKFLAKLPQWVQTARTNANKSFLGYLRRVIKKNGNVDPDTAGERIAQHKANPAPREKVKTAQELHLDKIRAERLAIMAGNPPARKAEQLSGDDPHTESVKRLKMLPDAELAQVTQAALEVMPESMKSYYQRFGWQARLITPFLIQILDRKEP